MILLSASGLCRQFDAAPVLDQVAVEVRRGDKAGLIGPNGCGKTTLLKILAGQGEPDRGEVQRHTSADVSLLEQDADFSTGRTLFEEARRGIAQLYRLQSEAHQLAERIAEAGDPEELEKRQRRFDWLQHELARHRAYNLDHRVEEVLAGLGFQDGQYSQRVDQLSGGQQGRLLLAKTLLRGADVMLLDEPTNHLDVPATEWLEEFLLKSDHAVVLVSHDRYFLDRVTNRTLELTGGVLTAYRGNFCAYWRQRQQRQEVLQRTHEKQQEFKEKAEDFIRRNKYGQKHAQAADRERKLERLEEVRPLEEIPVPAMTFGKATRRSGDIVIEATNLTQGFGAPLFRDLTLRVHRGQKIGILGPNGSGKTTLLRTLLGKLPPQSGSVRLGTGVEIAYFDQQLEGLHAGGVDAIDAVRPENEPDFTPADARRLLARFGITGDAARQPVESMSGGERTKVALARLAARNANLLVLDEPTNHLDIWSRAALESAFNEYDGTVLFVTHDRYLVDQVADAVLVLRNGKWRYFEGNYSRFVEFVRNQGLDEPAQPGTGAKSALSVSLETRGDGGEASRDSQRAGKDRKRRRRRFPYRKVDDLEAEIADVEKQIGRLQAELADPDVHRDGERARQALEKFEQTRTRLDALYEHWEEAVELN